MDLLGRCKSAPGITLTELAQVGAGFDNPRMDANLPKPRRWFRFSLRTVFLVVTVGCCWMGYQASIVSHRKMVRAEIEARGGKCYGSCERGVVVGYTVFDLPSKPYHGAFVRRLMGDDDYLIQLPANVDGQIIWRARRAFPDSAIWIEPKTKSAPF